MNSTPNLTELRRLLGLTDAPLVMKNLEIVSNFFVHKLHQSPFNWLSYFKGIDFSRPTDVGYLNQGREIVRHKPDNGRPKPFLYFSEVGTSPMRTGTNFPHVTFERYEATSPISALFSFASWISFSPSDGIIRPGGAKQIIIPAVEFGSLKKK